jgi:hypothetical protein
MAMAAAVEAVGARLSEQASSLTRISSATLLAAARVEWGLPVSETIGTPRRSMVSSSARISSVSPP